MKTNMAHKAKFSGAFTLVEIMWVTAVIGILVALIIPRIHGSSNEARVIAAKNEITGEMKTALDRYERDMGAYPGNLQDLLIAPDKNTVRWHGPYLAPAVLPRDPWGNFYLYAYPGKHNPASYDLWSTGSDDESGTDDDIGNWQAP
jgi:general secretion pathway protein G